MQLDSFVRDIVLMAEPAGPRVPGGNAFMSCALQIFSFFNLARMEAKAFLLYTAY